MKWISECRREKQEEARWTPGWGGGEVAETRSCQEAPKQDGQGVRVAAAVSVAGTVMGRGRSAGGRAVGEGGWGALAGRLWGHCKDSGFYSKRDPRDPSRIETWQNLLIRASPPPRPRRSRGEGFTFQCKGVWACSLLRGS